MTKKIIFILLISIFPPVHAESTSDNEPFHWKADTEKGGKVFYCGPEKLSSPHNVWSSPKRQKGYFYFHIAKDGDFVLLWNRVQYTNFSKTTIEDTYYQLGGIFTAEHKEENNINIFTLNREYSKSWSGSKKTTTVMVNLENKTFTARNQEGNKYYEPWMGFCWQHNSEGYEID